MELNPASSWFRLRIVFVAVLALAWFSVGRAQLVPVPPDRSASGDGVSAPDSAPWPANTVPQLLGGWLFEPGRLASAVSEVPWWMTNLVLVPAGDLPGSALRLDSTGPAAIRFAVRQSNQAGEFSVRNGSAGFWFRPHWTSGTASAPSQLTPLLEVGAQTAERVGWWALCLAGGGREAVFITQSGGQEVIPLRVPVSFSADAWVHLMLTWSPSQSALFLNGQRLGIGQGITRWPLQPERERWGWGIGGDGSGVLQVRGDYDTL